MLKVIFINKPVRYLWLFCLLLTSSISLSSYAQSFCFLSAATYYEQVYCELQAKGEARDLPPFHQFKRNDENIQAVLLKRPAERARINLPPPKKKSPKAASSSRVAPRLVPVSGSDALHTGSLGTLADQSHALSEAATSGSTGCELTENFIHCGEGIRYQLVGNRLNHRLADTALTDDNRMALPIFAGDAADANAVNRYLGSTYRQYIEKMHEIGLAGATLTYSKFYFLFYDLQEKGLNFSQRFETMYGFLKKDKATMGVSENRVADQQLQIADCDSLSDQLWVCSRAGRNYLYVAVSD